MLELYYNLLKKFCDTEKYEELEMDTDPLYSALSERTWKIIFSKRKETNGKQYVRAIVQIASLRKQQPNSSKEHAVLLTRSMIRESRDYLKKNSGVQNCCACVAKRIVATIERVTSTNSVVRDSIKKLRKTVEMVPCQNIAKC